VAEKSIAVMRVVFILGTFDTYCENQQESNHSWCWRNHKQQESPDWTHTTKNSKKAPTVCTPAARCRPKDLRSFVITKISDFRTTLRWVLASPGFVQTVAPFSPARP